MCRRSKEEVKDKERDQAVVKELFFGKAEASACQALEAGAHGQVLAFQGLQGRFARPSFGRFQFVHVRPPGIGQPVVHPPAGLGQHSPQAPEGGVRAPAEDEGQYAARGSLLHPLDPARGALAAYKGPYLIGAQPQRGGRIGHVARPHRLALVHVLDLFFSSTITVCALMPNTRAVSRMPLPFKARAVMRARTSGSCM